MRYLKQIFVCRSYEADGISMQVLPDRDDCLTPATSRVSPCGTLDEDSEWYLLFGKGFCLVPLWIYIICGSCVLLSSYITWDGL